MGDGIKSFYERMVTSNTSTSTRSEPTTLTLDKMVEAIKKIKSMPPSPLFYASNLIDPDSYYKLNPQQSLGLLLWGAANFAVNFDKSTKEMYICGKNVRDQLIDEGIHFENYQPEEEN